MGIFNKTKKKIEGTFDEDTLKCIEWGVRKRFDPLGFKSYCDWNKECP